MGPQYPFPPVRNMRVWACPFDRTGHRLGYGRGYYDRALEKCRPDCQKVGFAYDFQVIGTLPIMEEHDRTLSVLMTEQRRLNFTNR